MPCGDAAWQLLLQTQKTKFCPGVLGTVKRYHTGTAVILSVAITLKKGHCHLPSQHPETSHVCGVGSRTSPPATLRLQHPHSRVGGGEVWGVGSATSLTGRRPQRLSNQEVRAGTTSPRNPHEAFSRRSPVAGGRKRREHACVNVRSSRGGSWSGKLRRRGLFPRPLLIGWYETSGAGSPNSSRASAAEMEEEGPSFRKELVNKLLSLHFKDDRCKVSADALQLMVEMLKIFVREAAARAIRQAQAEDLDKVGIEQLEKVLPQLLLDF
ncbi:centromere protein X [Notamacropus eugenii]|uniref:centromere protein X n=1 Tax=Notamacropus eugenii TaxID=9315 RepID=UPI003B6822FF